MRLLALVAEIRRHYRQAAKAGRYHVYLPRAQGGAPRVTASAGPASVVPGSAAR